MTPRQQVVPSRATSFATHASPNAILDRCEHQTTHAISTASVIIGVLHGAPEQSRTVSSWFEATSPHPTAGALGMSMSAILPGASRTAIPLTTRPVSDVEHFRLDLKTATETVSSICGLHAFKSKPSIRVLHKIAPLVASPLGRERQL